MFRYVAPGDDSDALRGEDPIHYKERRFRWPKLVPGQVFPFLSLPPELRNAIYEAVIDRSKLLSYRSINYTVRPSKVVRMCDFTRLATEGYFYSRGKPELFYTCKQVHDEALAVLLERNYIKAYPLTLGLARLIGPSGLQACNYIRRLDLGSFGANPMARFPRMEYPNQMRTSDAMALVSQCANLSYLEITLRPVDVCTPSDAYLHPRTWSEYSRLKIKQRSVVEIIDRYSLDQMCRIPSLSQFVIHLLCYGMDWLREASENDSGSEVSLDDVEILRRERISEAKKMEVLQVWEGVKEKLAQSNPSVKVLGGVLDSTSY